MALKKDGQQSVPAPFSSEKASDPHRHPLSPGGGVPCLRQNLERLGPTYIKMGQMLSVRPDVLPKEALDELAVLQVVPCPP